MSARPLILPSALAVAGLGSAYVEILQSAEHYDMPLVWAVIGCGSMGALALIRVVSTGARMLWCAIVEDQADAEPPAAEESGAPALLRPPGRHAANRTPPGDALHGFRVCRLYTAFERLSTPSHGLGAFERGNGWDL